MTPEEIEKLWPEFQHWMHKVKGYCSAGSLALVQLWYEWLEERGDNK